jgi:hypothetical protein
VQLVFQGTGTRWTSLLTKADHPAHALYQAVEDTVAGVSAGCAVFFGGLEEAERTGFSLIATNAVPGTAGLPSLAKYAADGYTILTF